MSSYLQIFALLILTSCTLSLSKKEREEHTLPPPQTEESISDAFCSGIFIEGEWPRSNWWKEYGSTELNTLIEEALQNNPSIQAIQQRIQYAKAETVVARSKLFPLIFFSAEDQQSYLSKNGLYRALNPNIALNNTQIDFSLSFSYEFDFWGKYRNLYNASLGREKAAIAEGAQIELLTAVSLAQAYFALRTQQLRKTLYEQLYHVRKWYFQLQKDRVKHSVSSQLPPLLSEEAVFQSEQLVYQIDREISLSKHLVNILVGRGPDMPIECSEGLKPLPEKLQIPRSISLDLLARRPDLMAQVWHVDALAREVGAAKANYWPDINLLLFAGLQSGSWSKLLEWASGTIGAQPGLTLPIYTAGAIGANIDGKKALFVEAVFQYNELMLQSFQQVTDLLALCQAVYKEKEKQTHIVENALIRYDLAVLRQKLGLDSALPTYQLLEEVLTKRLEDVELLYQQYLMSVSLIKALGGGYHE